jgi:magnesium chelatase family protein
VLRGVEYRLAGSELQPLHDEFARGRLSARGADRVLRLAWTLADLAGVQRPGFNEVAHAVHLRTASVLSGLAA